MHNYGPKKGCMSKKPDNIFQNHSKKYKFIMRGLPDFLLKVLLSPEERVSARERKS